MRDIRRRSLQLEPLEDRRVLSALSVLPALEHLPAVAEAQGIPIAILAHLRAADNQLSVSAETETSNANANVNVSAETSRGSLIQSLKLVLGDKQGNNGKSPVNVAVNEEIRTVSSSSPRVDALALRDDVPGARRDSFAVPFERATVPAVFSYMSTPGPIAPFLPEIRSVEPSETLDVAGTVAIEIKREEAAEPHRQSEQAPGRWTPGAFPSEASAVEVEASATGELGGAPVAQEIGLLAGNVPQNEAALDLALQQFLEQLDDLGRDLSQTLSSHPLLAWAIGACLGVAAADLTRRRIRHLRSRVVLAQSGPDNALSWMPGVPGPFSTEEA